MGVILNDELYLLLQLLLYHGRAISLNKNILVYFMPDPWQALPHVLHKSFQRLISLPLESACSRASNRVA